MKGLNGTVSTIQTIFIVLKLVGAISWSWWWVLSPLWIPLAILQILLTTIYLIDKYYTTTMKNFSTAEIRDLFNRVMMEEISFSEMVEVINERVVEPRFKEGDFVKDVRYGAICIYHDTSDNGCIVSHAGSNNGYTTTKTGTGWGYTKDFRHATEEEKQILLDELAKEGKIWNAEKLCIEDIPDELKKGDLAIFWDNEKKIAVIKSYDRSIGSEEEYFQHKDQSGFSWLNAIKFESKEQYEKLIKGDI